MVLICAYEHFSIIFRIANIGKGASFFYSDRSKAKQALYFETLASDIVTVPPDCIQNNIKSPLRKHRRQEQGA